MKETRKTISPGKSIAILVLSLAVLLYCVAGLKANPGVSLILASLAAVFLGMAFGYT